MSRLGEHRYNLGSPAHPGVTRRDRELAILPGCARISANTIWGFHARMAGMSVQEVAATTRGLDDWEWPQRDRNIVAFTDALCDGSDISDGLWAVLGARWSEDDLLRLVVLVGWYQLHRDARAVCEA